MPSKMIDPQSFSPSSYITEEVHFPSERQIGFWNSETKIESYVTARSGVSSPLDKPLPVEFQGMDCIKYPETYQVRESKASTNLGRLAVGAERNGSRSPTPWTYADQNRRANFKVNAQSPSYFSQDAKTNMMTSQYENGLFSSSMSDLFSTKLRFTTNGIPYGHSVDTVPHHFEGEEPFESSKEVEAQTIGNLLPDDDDLLSGVTNLLDKEDLDLFSSVGGIELGDDGSSTGQENTNLFEEISNRPRGGFSESTIGEHPSRTLLVQNINNNIDDKELQALFELYGDIQTLYTAGKHRGFVIISYYDLRAARNAMRALQNMPLRHRILDIHFSIPKDNLTAKDINQGSLVVFNLDSSVSNDELYKIFGIHGDIKEIRETSHRSNHKFIEFYDLRSAEAALGALNRTIVAGKRIEVETSHTGGPKKQCSTQQLIPELEQTELLQNSRLPNKSSGIFGSVPLGDFTSGITKEGNRPFMESPFHHEISSSVPNGLSSMGRVESFRNQFGLPMPGHSHSHGQLQFEYQGMPALHPHSLPEYQDSFPRNSPNIMSASTRQRSSGRIENGHFSGVNIIGNPLKLNESVFSSGNESCSLPLHHYMWANSHNPRPPSMMWSNSPSHFDRSPIAHHPSQLHGLPRPPSYISNPVIPLNNNHVGSAPTIYSSPWDRQHSFVGESPKSVGMHSPHQRSMMFAGRGQMLPMMSSFDNPNERRSRRNENNQNNPDNTIQYELDVERIMAGEDTRTTLMLKNIPNKYTSKMLLAALDERHRGTYDFIYLPIDFKNKCNVGYAFINMINPSVIVPFYEAFNGKKWEKFNSEKVASLAYARIQGKTALVSHFQNSSLMNEDKRCRPILFHTEGPNAGDQVPFPVGVNIRPRLSKTQTSINEEISQGSPPNLPNRENSTCGDSYSGSSRDSD